MYVIEYQKGDPQKGDPPKGTHKKGTHIWVWLTKGDPHNLFFFYPQHTLSDSPPEFISLSHFFGGLDPPPVSGYRLESRFSGLDHYRWSTRSSWLQIPVHSIGSEGPFFGPCNARKVQLDKSHIHRPLALGGRMPDVHGGSGGFGDSSHAQSFEAELLTFWFSMLATIF